MHTNLLHTIETGSPADPVIVFLHGGPLSSRMWQPQLELLSEDFYCLAPDMPGHGKSQAEAFTLEGAAKRVAELIHAKAPGGKAIVVGLSLGGAVALTLLRTAPEVVERAMVSGTAARLGKFLGKLSLALLGPVGLIPVEKQAEATLKQLAVPGACRDLVWEDLIHGATPAYSQTVIAALMGMELPQAVSCPLLIAVGEKETLPARQAAEKLRKCYPQAQSIVVPGLHHLWNLENPALFANTVRAWAAGKPLPS
ncbi:MAG: alpha/beta hydrolase [Anaerolineaceae bacterium]|nr:alpha/beta hydrolase [Anaerolineaceae bacterium]